MVHPVPLVPRRCLVRGAGGQPCLGRPRRRGRRPPGRVTRGVAAGSGHRRARRRRRRVQRGPGGSRQPHPDASAVEVPIVGAQVDAARRATAAASDGAAAAHRAVSRLDDLANGSPSAGPERVAALRQTGRCHRRRLPRPSTDRCRLIRPTTCFGPLDDAHGRIIEARRKGAGRPAQGSGLLAGPSPDSSRARTATCSSRPTTPRCGRAAGRSCPPPRSFARDGRLRLGAVNPTADLVLPEGTVPVRGDLQTNWGWLHPANGFGNLGLTPTIADRARRWRPGCGRTPPGGTTWRA